MDTMDARWDRTVSDFILGNACNRAGAASSGAAGSSDAGTGHSADNLDSPWWTLERLKAYVAYVRARFEPKLQREAQHVLMRYYELQRRADSRSAARTTLRMLESLIRLTQAHARLMWRDVATVEDAVVAVSLMESSMFAGAVLGSDSVAHTDFVADPDALHRKTQALVLARLTMVGGGGGEGGTMASGAISQRAGDARELAHSWPPPPAAAGSASGGRAGAGGGGVGSSGGGGSGAWS